MQQNKDLFNIGTNIQQDVTEFTHIVIDWVEEAFKNEVNKPQQDGGEAMDADCEKENNEEKEIGIPELPETNANPMARLFYGKVLLEGTINGDAFSKEEAFGQWNIPVNNFVNIHESIENSLAPEALGKNIDMSWIQIFETRVLEDLSGIWPYGLNFLMVKK